MEYWTMIQWKNVMITIPLTMMDVQVNVLCNQDTDVKKQMGHLSVKSMKDYITSIQQHMDILFQCPSQKMYLTWQLDHMDISKYPSLDTAWVSMLYK